MSALADKVITWLFVGILGGIWLLTARCQMPHPYSISVYYLGRKARIDGIKTRFRTHGGAESFARHYSEIFPPYTFEIRSCVPQTRPKFLPAKDQR